MSQVEERIRAWDPALELSWEAGIPRLYDGCATQYVVVLGETELQTDRRRVAVGRGDFIAVAADTAVELREPVDGLILRDLGPAPAHFRERFIQVWGFELLRREAEETGWVIHVSNAGAGRGAYRVEVQERAGTAVGDVVAWGMSPLECGLILPLEGDWLEVDEARGGIRVGEVGFVRAGEAVAMRARGRGQVVRIPAPGLRPDRASLGPEWRPGGARID